ncbi:hypothetical protein AB0D24_44190 [Streptomyces javensis]|uniref:hypothetical protein n=1 Tax=Streptomyces javensis TaxID=114698 RepID=UPI00340DF27E
MPDSSTSNPYTTEAKPFGPNQAAAGFSRHAKRVSISEISNDAVRTTTMAGTTAA